MGAAYAKHKERRRKREARDALKAPRLPRLYFSRPHDATNVRGGVLSLVSDVEATAALASELNSTITVFCFICSGCRQAMCLMCPGCPLHVVSSCLQPRWHHEAVECREEGEDTTPGSQAVTRPLADGHVRLCFSKY